MPVGRLGIRAKLQAIADELLSPKNCVDGGQQIGPGTWFVNVAQRAQAEGFSYHIGGGLLTEEQNFRSRSKLRQSLSDLEPVQVRQANIKQNQIRLQPFGFFNSFQPIQSFGEPKLTPCLQHRTNESAEAFKVIDYKYAKRSHYSSSLYSNPLGVILRPRRCFFEADATQFPEQQTAQRHNSSKLQCQCLHGRAVYQVLPVP